MAHNLWAANHEPPCDTRFYEKLGFKLVSIKKDYYGVGLDRYDMIKSKH